MKWVLGLNFSYTIGKLRAKVKNFEKAGGVEPPLSNQQFCRFTIPGISPLFLAFYTDIVVSWVVGPRPYYTSVVYTIANCVPLSG